MEGKKYLEKGYYTHPQMRGYMVLKHFMLVRQGDKRCLLLRFVNESSMEVNAMEFVLTQKDSRGRVIASNRIRYRNMRVGKDEIFSRNSGIVVNEDCVDFEVRLVSVVSGIYKYRFKKGQPVAHFDKRGYSNKAVGFVEDEYVSVSSQYFGGAGTRWLIAFLSLAVVVAVSVAKVFA